MPLFIVISLIRTCRRSNNYGTTPTLPAGERIRSGNNNNAPHTPNTQIFCLHGRSNNIEVEGKFL